MRLPVFFFCCVLLSPVPLFAEEGNEVDLLIRKGQEHQNKAFQAGPDERKRHLRSAIGEYEKVFYLAPEKDIAYVLAGSCYEHLGEFQKAAETYALGAERVVARNGKLLLLSNVARVHANTKNLRGVADVIEQMESIDPLAIEIAMASRDMTVDSPDERTRVRYARKCVRICDHHLKHSKDPDVREVAANLKRSLPVGPDAGTPAEGGADQGGQPSTPWEGILADSRRGDHEKAVTCHQNMLAAASSLDPLSKSYVNPVPDYLPYLDALLESYVRTGRWDGFFGLARRPLLRRDEVLDESFQRHPVGAIPALLDRHLRSYLAGPRKFDFARPARAVLVPRLWLHEIKGDELSADSVNDINEAFPDRDVLALGRWGKGGGPNWIILRFSLPPALSGLRIRQAVVSFLRAHRHAPPGSHEDGLPALCEIETDGERRLPGKPPRCPQADRVIPDADGLMRRDIGKIFGGYAISQLCSFDVTAMVKAGQKRGKLNYALAVALQDDAGRAFRSFWSTKSSYSPKVSIVVQGSAPPEADEIIEYEEDWVDLYARGLSYVQDGKLGAAEVVWEEAAKRSGDGPAAASIQKHLALIKGVRR